MLAGARTTSASLSWFTNRCAGSRLARSVASRAAFTFSAGASMRSICPAPTLFARTQSRRRGRVGRLRQGPDADRKRRVGRVWRYDPKWVEDRRRRGRRRGGRGWRIEVPPYAIVVGNPGRVVAYRFDEATVARLLALRWWDWTDERIAEMEPYFYAGVEPFLTESEERFGSTNCASDRSTSHDPRVRVVGT